jgi:predicted thioesterase
MGFMDFSEILTPGLKGERSETVTDKNTAAAWGSGGLPVYATPAMAALMEGAALSASDPLLPEGWSTVGTELAIKHLSASPPGMKIRAEAELLSLDGRTLVFRVEAFDEAGKIGEGTHGRFIVEEERFLKKALGKKIQAP